ncbi:LysR family transcriptional regulator [Furfurilactobacillus rossiae]|uniref:Transcription regulator n=1 Tax=Furfurilactobacillus rossiae DSM 15814 TaxID=1114972 RepID=A0A0R1RLX8_9LACO|nr:LysR family transcriptional regulator [Furfurilactobacillus rossiae]KRL54555.1 transcription regulator [Furfurilactobacillus rossiae DSM 15814]QFR67334.1 LysR family transcriptional regulator [Furfurilactobacillus rossiae]QLE60270.1 transcription regulator [Furfurilactobacillus rossiae]
MNLRHLLFFQELARTQHMAIAAEHLGISQPSLSYAISGLEKELGVPLFEHEGRNIRLTRFGKTYLAYVDAGLAKLSQGETLIQQLMDANTGHIDLGFTYTLGQGLVPSAINAFQHSDTNAHISFSLTQGNSYQLLQDLRQDKLDLVLASRIQKLGDTDANKEFLFTPLVKQEIVLAVPIHHPLTHKKNVFVSDIAKYSLIAYSQSSGLRPLLDKILEHSGIEPKIKYEVEEDYTIVSFVEHGFGIALVPNLPQLKQEHVKLIHLTDNYVAHQLYLVTKINQFMAPSVTRFKEFLMRYCASDINGYE